MKTKLLLLLPVLLFATFSYSQTYSYSKLVKKAIVQTSSGTEQRILNTIQGPFRIIFETPNDPQCKRLFTILNPGHANGPGLPWFGLLKDIGYVEKENKLLKESLYYDTENDEKVHVLIADDYSLIVIFKSDDTIWEYIQSSSYTQSDPTFSEKQSSQENRNNNSNPDSWEVYTCAMIYDRPDMINGKEVTMACDGRVTVIVKTNEDYYYVQYKTFKGYLWKGMLKK